MEDIASRTSAMIMGARAEIAQIDAGLRHFMRKGSQTIDMTAERRAEYVTLIETLSR